MSAGAHARKRGEDRSKGRSKDKAKTKGKGKAKAKGRLKVIGKSPKVTRKSRAKSRPKDQPKARATTRKSTSPGTRRNRVPVVLGAVFALAIIGTSFPFSTLLSQHRVLSAEAAQLRQIQGDNQLLAEQDRQLSSSTEVDRLARQEFQLVLPGQTLFDVLPPSGTSVSTTRGDPANQPLVSPSSAPDMSPDPGFPRSVTPAGGAGTVHSTAGSGAGASSSDGKGSASSSSSFWSRVAGTLEFWK